MFPLSTALPHQQLDMADVMCFKWLVLEESK
jgi:hypothetical protein